MEEPQHLKNGARMELAQEPRHLKNGARMELAQEPQHLKKRGPDGARPASPNGRLIFVRPPLLLQVSQYAHSIDLAGFLLRCPGAHTT